MPVRRRVPVSRATNLTRTLKDWAAAGLQVVGLDANGDTTLDELDASGPIVVVVGSEGKGLSRLVRENCDAVVSIPMAGPTESLNAAVAAGVVLAEVACPAAVLTGRVRIPDHRLTPGVCVLPQRREVNGHTIERGQPVEHRHRRVEIVRGVGQRPHRRGERKKSSQWIKRPAAPRPCGRSHPSTARCSSPVAGQVPDAEIRGFGLAGQRARHEARCPGSADAASADVEPTSTRPPRKR